MFFLKELPTRSIIDAYTSHYAKIDSGVVESALTMMRKASLLIRKLEAYFVQHDLSQLRFLVLIVIDRELDRTSLLPNEIAERLDISRPVTTRTLKGLIQEGLVATQADASDGRAKQISLTKTGHEKLQSVLPGYFELIMNFMSALDAKK